MSQDLGKTTVGMDANLAGLLAYAFGWVSGLLFFLIEKENKFVRFHAMQSMLIFGFLFVLVYVTGWIMPVLFRPIQLVMLIVWILGMVKAYQGEWFKFPVIGDIAQKQA